MAYKKTLILIVLPAAILAFTGCPAATRDKTNTDTYSKTESSTIVHEQELPKDQNTSQEKSQQQEKELDPIEEQIKGMTLEEKVSQMVIVGLKGYTVNDNTRTMIEKYHIGGFILFSRNVESSGQLLNLINSLKSTNSANKAKAPLFISVDEEGGDVSRMPEELIKLPANKQIGEINSSDFSYKIGGILADLTKSFGFNMNFAPVLDINSNPQNPVIGDRSFGNSAEVVSKLGVQTMKGIREGGVIPVVKHFPGHGDTSVDSHVGLPAVDNSMDRLKSFELVPFNEAIQNGADAVMTAHILVNSIDPQNPASLSKVIITDLLRNQLGFSGVVVSDDITMGAIVKNYNLNDAAVRAVNAGNDIILVCHGHDNGVAVIEALIKAAETGAISNERLEESVYRILKLKNKYNLTDSITDSIDIEKINDKISRVLGT